MASPSQPTAAPSADPHVVFAAQLRQLHEMGFVDDEANIRVLRQTNGNVNAALDRLLGGGA